jgi:multidrug resistance efflux pump
MTIAAKPQKELVNPIKPSVGLPLSALLNRLILFGAGAGLLTWGLMLTANRVSSVTATKAFINGQIITITSPLSGQVQTKASLDSGMAVTPKQMLLNVNEPLSNSQWVQSLKLDLITEQAKLESIETKIRKLARSGNVSQPKPNQQQNEQKVLEIETDKAQKVALARLEEETLQTEGTISVRLAEQNLKDAEIELKVTQGHAQVAKSKYDKYQALAKEGAMSTFSVEEVLNNWKVSKAQVEAAQVKLDTAKVHLAEQRKLNGQKAQQRRLQTRVAQSTPKKLPISTNNTKAEDLNPELAELMQQKTGLEVSIEAKKKAIAEAEKSSMAQKNYQVLASTQGVLWEVMVHNGEQVNSGQTLLKQLNCDQLWVDAFVNMDALKRIQIGSPAQVELYGDNVKLNGWVKTIRSPLSREQKLGQDVAVNPPNVENQQLAQVRIELENSKALTSSNQSSAQFCQVGQVAKVNINPKDSMLANLPSW